jgi:membrane protein YdbS with pleckstrin-like domain
MRIRPSIKLILAAYAFTGLLELAILGYYFSSEERPLWILLLLLVPVAGQMMAAMRQVSKMTSSLTVKDGRIRFEEGMISRATRTLDLSKVQDVQVRQSPLQRMLNIGDLSLETAGESGRLLMSSVDNPHELAERILDLARG